MNEVKELILEAIKQLNDEDTQIAYKAQSELITALRTLSNAEEFKPDLRLAIAY